MKIKKIIKYFTNTLFVFLFLFGAIVIFSLLPIAGNIKLLTVRSGSMEPSIHTGSLIFIKPMPGYDIGDIVTKLTDEEDVTVTHRIISKELINNETLFETKGDANNIPDNEKITDKKIVGKVLLDIPLLGYPVGFAKTTRGLIIIIIIPALIIVIDEMFKIQKEIEKKIDYKKRISKRKKEDNAILDSDEYEKEI